MGIRQESHRCPFCCLGDKDESQPVYKWSGRDPGLVFHWVLHFRLSWVTPLPTSPVWVGGIIPILVLSYFLGVCLPSLTSCFCIVFPYVCHRLKVCLPIGKHQKHSFLFIFSQVNNCSCLPIGKHTCRFWQTSFFLGVL